MKKLLILALLVLFCTASILPPALPSSFYGYVVGKNMDGRTVAVFVDGVRVARTTVFSYEGQAVYTVDVPMDDVPDGTIAIFKIGKVVCGTGVLHSGTAQELNLTFSRR